MSGVKQCQKCGVPLAATVLHGMCPNCLVLVTFDTAAEQPTLACEAAGPRPQGAQPVLSKTVRYIGDYELVEEIARGAMGVVFKARQVSLNRLVALKMILRGHFADAKEVQRFKTEAEAAAGLAHPNLVGIYEVGEHQGLHYYTMQLVTGSSLAECGDRYRDDFPGVVGLLAKSARAVHHAHQHGILHRDLKPGNILVDTAGEPHVTDFGLAKNLEGSSDLTQADTLLGTPAFMAPEQALGLNQHLTTAADIYSLGAVLFHLLTGKAPFSGQNSMQVLKLVAEAEPPRPSALNPRVDRDLETICLKCLEKAPERRYGSAEAMAEDLERWLRKEPISARPLAGWERTAKWVRRRPALAALACALFLVSAGGLATVLWQLSETRKARTEAVTKAGAEAEAKKEAQGERRRAESLLSDSQLQLAEWSLKEKDVGAAAGQLAAVLRREPTNMVAANRLLSLLLSEDMIVPAVAEPNLPPGYQLEAIHPNFQHVAVSSNGVIEVWDVLSNQMSGPLLRHPSMVRAAGFDPSGETLFVLTTNRLHAWNWRDGFIRWDGQPTFRPVPGWRLSFSADGQLVARSQPSGINVQSTKTGALVCPLIPLGTEPLLSPDGRHLAAFNHILTNSSVRLRVYSTANGELLSPEMSETNWLKSWFVAGGPFLAALSSKSPTPVFSSEGRWHLSVWNYESGNRVFGPHTVPAPSSYWELSEVGLGPSGRMRLVKQSGRDVLSIVEAFSNTTASPVSGTWQGVRNCSFSRDEQELLHCSGVAVSLFDQRTGLLRSRSTLIPFTSYQGLYSDGDRRILTWAGIDQNIRPFRSSLDLPGLRVQPWITLRGNHGSEAKEIRMAWSAQPDVGPAGFPAGVLRKIAELKARIPDNKAFLSRGSELHGTNYPVLIRNSQNGSFAAVIGDKEGHLQLWNLKTQSEIRIDWQPFVPDPVRQVRFSPDEKHCLAKFLNRSVAAISLPEGKALALVDAEPEFVVDEMFSEDASCILRLTGTGRVCAYHLPTGRKKCELTIPDSKTFRARLSPSGHRAFIMGFETSRLYDLDSGVPVGDVYPYGHGSRGSSIEVQFSQNGKTVAIWRAESVKVMDTQNGKTYAVNIPGDIRFAIPSLSGDGSTLVYRDGLNSAFTLELASGTRRRFAHDGPCYFTELDHTGGRLLTLTTAGAYIWDVHNGRRLHGPIREKDTELAFFTDSPNWVGFLCRSGTNRADQQMTLRLAEVPNAQTPVPAWLPDLAEAIGGVSSDTNRTTMGAWATTTGRIREILKTAPADDYYANWARWFLAPPETRRATPNSPYTTQEYVEQLSAIGTLDTLREATRLSPTNALAYARLAKATLDQPEAATRFYLRSEADHLSQLATRLDPANVEVQRMRGELVNRLELLRKSP